MLGLEIILVVLAFAVAFLAPGLGSSVFRPMERAVASLARRRFTSVLTVGLSAIAFRLALLPIFPIPQPNIHDEFSYLLMADTFSHGRLTNPTHPMWTHFETFHEIQKPSYASMYYPAQGAFLAFGKVVFGHPYWGVLLSSGLMCTAICWMLQAWFPPFWALVGGLLAVIRLGTVSYWANSYWGGAVAALGGALVLGALPRIKRHQRSRDAVLMGLGFALLANSRPYESLFFAAPVLVALLMWAKQKAVLRRILAGRVIAPLGVVLIFTVGAMGYYFWRITGNPLRTPFFVNLATYNPVPYFPWQTVKAIPAYRHAELRNFYLNWWMPIYELARHHPVVTLILKFWNFALFYLGPLFGGLLLVAAITLPYGISFTDLSRRTRFMLLVCGSVVIGISLPVTFNSHYAAPITAAVYALILTALQRLRKWKPSGKTTGLALVRLTVLTAIVLFVGHIIVPGNGTEASTNLPTWCAPAFYRTWRSEISKQLSFLPGNHLIIVRYAPGHPPINEWVFNSADIDGSKIVWARDAGPQGNAELVRYFRERKVWVVEPDRAIPTLAAYAPADSIVANMAHVESRQPSQTHATN